MKYLLRAHVIHPVPVLDLSAQDFAELRAARKTLIAAFSLEEIFNLLLVNYRELEVAALEAAANEMIHWKTEYSDFFDVRSELNRRAVNFLSTARLYVDQVQQWVRETGANPDAIKVALSAEYDANFGFRFVEALRNHVQHCGRAVHRVTTQSKWLPAGEQEVLEICVQPVVSKDSLQEDQKFKKSVLAECGDQIPLLPQIRTYVEAIGRVHRVVRTSIDPLTTSSRQLFDQRIAQYTQASGEDYPGLTATANEGNSVLESVPIFIEWDNVRMKLVRKNQNLASLQRSRVSSSPSA